MSLSDLPKTEFKNVYIDADILVYRAAHVALQESIFPDGIIAPSSNVNVAKDYILQILEPFKEAIKAENWYFVLSGQENFRKDICKDYKGNRKDFLKPFGFHAVRETVKKLGKVIGPGDEYAPNKRLPKNIEADDIIGILMTQRGNKDKCLAISSDKDFKTIPGWHLGLFDNQMHHIDTKCAQKFHFIQTLAGDTADGYPGCPKIGTKRASALLSALSADASNNLEKSWSAVIDAFKKQNKDEPYALMQAQMAKILTSEWITESGNVILFHPKGPDFGELIRFHNIH